MDHMIPSSLDDIYGPGAESTDALAEAYDILKRQRDNLRIAIAAILDADALDDLDELEIAISKAAQALVDN